MTFTAFIIPSFFAGVLTFLAPCTLPLVPGFIAFMSGGVDQKQNKPRLLWNTLWYIVGFSSIFILFGTVFSVAGSYFIEYRYWLGRIGGVLIIFFGLFLVGFSRLPFMRWMNAEKSIHLQRILHPGKPLSSFLFGATFAFGWTPCVGPILGSVLLLASTSTTIVQGAFLLAVFSFGLAVPFFLVALGLGSLQTKIKKLYTFLPRIQQIGGVLLIGIGILLVFDKMNAWIGYAFKILSFIHYDTLLEYL